MARRRTKWIIAVAVVLGIAAIAVAAIARNGREPQKETPPDLPTLAAKIGDLQVIVREIGTVEPEVKVDIKSTLSGRIVDLPVRAGDSVTKGQLIARIEPDVNQAQDLLTIKNRVREASIGLSDAKEEYEAKRQLFENGLISVEVNRQAETRYLQAQQAVDAALEKVGLVEASGVPVGGNPKQVVNIVSPMTGVIIDRPAELGETVTGSGSFNAGTVIATVADLATLLVRAGINEVDIGKIHNSQDVRVTLDAFPRELFPGTISRIAPAARLDAQVKVFDVEIALGHLGRALRTGMTANIEIRGETKQSVLRVPVESVFLRGEEEVVYVLRDEPLPKTAGKKDENKEEGAAAEAENGDGDAGQTAVEEDWRSDPRQQWRRWFEERQVVTGIASTTNVEIVSGLKEGEKIALADPSRPKEERT